MIGVGHWEASSRERELINEVLDSGRLSYGEKSRAFEAKFSEIHGSRHGVLSNSGTSSLQVALQAMKEEHGWQAHHEVIVPATTFVATLNIVFHVGMTPVLIDVDKYTYNMDTWQLPGLINENTRVVLPVHLLGQMAAMSAIKDIVGRENLYRNHDNKIRILADSCECAFATQLGKPIGHWADISCFSTYMAHLIVTGVGGIATTDNPVYAQRIRSLVNHGRDGIYISLDDRENKEILDRRFKFVSIGHSFRVTELESALGLAQLETWEDMIKARQENAAYLIEGLKDLAALQLPYTLPGNTHSFMMFGLVLKGGNKWDFCRYLEDRGIETRELLPLINQPVYRIDQDRYPVSKWLNEQGVYIGCHQGLTKPALDHIISIIRGYYGQGN